ncbi:8-amino-7-oxononanoate synthase [gut metagenome]|uniref:8-amino-7-oxononanoate synthase n=1 Tax=gut metagenome TaxID=749906 RepID=J9G9V0_9ZZZZ
MLEEPTLFEPQLQGEPMSASASSNPLASLQAELQQLEARQNLRRLPRAEHCGKTLQTEGRAMLNLSSNDYLGLATDEALRMEFLQTLTPENFLPSASSARLLTGNFPAHEALEQELAHRFGRESALVFNSGYHMNLGILPAVCDARSLILADKLVHASLIDGIRLSGARCIRFRHNHYDQLEQLLERHHRDYERIVVVTESLFSMDGDEADLRRLVALKHRYPNVLLYVDEAHAIGVRGPHGLGCAEEQGCLADIDFLCGTFGKALASVGGYIVCSQLVRDYLVNRMRPFIFTTALPPVNLQWTLFLFRQLDRWSEARAHLQRLSNRLATALRERGYDCPSTSHILPLTVGESEAAVRKALELQRNGFYVLPVRPPTVPEGTSRLRLSLTAALTDEEIDRLIAAL